MSTERMANWQLLLVHSLTSTVVVTRLAASAAQRPQHRCVCGGQWLIFWAPSAWTYRPR